MKSNKNVIIVVIVSIVVIACVAIGRSGNTSAGGNISASYDSTISNNSVTIPTYPNDTYQTTQSYIPAQSSSYYYDYQYQTTEAAQTSLFSSGASYAARVSDYTPGDAGLNVRSLPSSEATLLTVISEGELVICYPDSLQNGYVYCELSGLPGGIAFGWLLADYVIVE